MIRNAFITLFALVLTAGLGGMTIVAAPADRAASIQVA